LNLKNCHIGAEAGELLAKGIEMTKSLKDLNLEGCKIGEKGGVEIGRGLKNNTTLETIKLCTNELREDALYSILDAIETHPSLKNVHLSGNRCRNCGPQLAKLVMNNKTIEIFDIMHTQLSADDIRIFCRGMEKNDTITELRMDVESHSGTKYMSDLSLGSLLQKNSTIKRIGRKTSYHHHKSSRFPNFFAEGLRFNTGLERYYPTFGFQNHDNYKHLLKDDYRTHVNNPEHR